MSMQLATRRSKAMAGSRAELYRMVSVAVQTVPDAFLFSFQGPFWDYVNSRDLGELQIHRMRGRKQKVPFFTEEASRKAPLKKSASSVLSANARVRRLTSLRSVVSREFSPYCR